MMPGRNGVLADIDPSRTRSSRIRNDLWGPPASRRQGTVTWFPLTLPTLNWPRDLFADGIMNTAE